MWARLLVTFRTRHRALKKRLQQQMSFLCEDTRVTSKLLSAFDIHVPLQRCDQNIIESQIEPTLERLRAGQRVAFVSDAGMPGISDPGQHLVDCGSFRRPCYRGYSQDLSAVTCALVASGLASDISFLKAFCLESTGRLFSACNSLQQFPALLCCMNLRLGCLQPLKS